MLRKRAAEDPMKASAAISTLNHSAQPKSSGSTGRLTVFCEILDESVEVVEQAELASWKLLKLVATVLLGLLLFGSTGYFMIRHLGRFIMDMITGR